MRGYCQECHKIVEMVNIVTRQLPNRRYIHEGYCPSKGCEGKIWKSIREYEIIVDDRGHKYPEDVYVGEDTPSRLLKIPAGQKLITKEGERVLEARKPTKRLDQVKEEVRDAKSKIMAG